MSVLREKNNFADIVDNVEYNIGKSKSTATTQYDSKTIGLGNINSLKKSKSLKDGHTRNVL